MFCSPSFVWCCSNEARVCSCSVQCSFPDISSGTGEVMIVSFHGWRHQRWGLHLAGRVSTDRRPRVTTAKNALSTAPTRLPAMLLRTQEYKLRTQEYNFTLSYKPGKKIPVTDAPWRTSASEAPTTIDWTCNWTPCHCHQSNLITLKRSEIDRWFHISERHSLLIKR